VPANTTLQPETKVEVLPAAGPVAKQRVKWVDYARGLAIVTIVYRHILIGLDRSGYEVSHTLDLIQQFILNFRMPVFFMLSGYFLEKSLQKASDRKVVKRRLATLLYPYILWGCIYLGVELFLSRYTNSERHISDFRYLVTQPRAVDHLWYLLALVNVSLLYIGARRLFRNQLWLHFAIAILVNLGSFFLYDYSLFSDPLFNYIFVLIGASLSGFSVEMNFTRTQFLYRLLALVPGFILLQLTWLALQPGNFSMQILFLMITIYGCLFFYFFARTMQAFNILPILSSIGKASLYIYILHVFVIAALRIAITKLIPGVSIYVFLLLGLLLGIGLPLLFYQISRRVKWIQYFFSLTKPR